MPTERRADLKCGLDEQSVRVGRSEKTEHFRFDRVFESDATQQSVFDEVTDLIESAIQGHKVCLFSYGQTGSGKTFTVGRSISRQSPPFVPVH